MCLPPIPVTHRAAWKSVSALLLALLLPLAAHARGPEPPQRIPLEPLGFQTISFRYLLSGATMLTLDYVDNRHLLVTFGVSKLMPRLADCPSDDEDRVVKAVLLEMPSGRELASTEWRFHDIGQYVWSLGGGHFLLRKRDTLTTFSPLENLSSGHAFEEQPFLHFDRSIQAILVSATHDLLSVESIKRPKVPPAEAFAQMGLSPASQRVSQSVAPSSSATPGLKRRGLNSNLSDAEPAPNPTQIDFIHVIGNEIPSKTVLDGPSSSSNRSAESHPARIVGRHDGRIFTSSAVSVPLTAAGFLRTRATTRDGVLLDFLAFDGKRIDLGDFATSCPPRPSFVSPSEFVIFGCRGSVDSLDLAGFNLHGDFLWQINFSEDEAFPSFRTAIAAGRFAFSRTVTSSHVFDNDTPSMSQLQDQEVRVIQTYNGKQLLKVVTSPIQASGQNYALSPDGLSLAVVHDNPTVKGDVTTHNTSIEIYKLPPLSEKDSTALRNEEAMAPLPSDMARMRFSAEEIKAALAAKPHSEDTGVAADFSSGVKTPADARIVGDPAPSPVAGSSSGTIPSSDPAPACATLTETSASLTAACSNNAHPKADPKPSSSSLPVGPIQDDTPKAPRKPPTLYEPPPSSPPNE